MAEFIWLKHSDGPAWKEPATPEGKVKWNRVAKSLKFEEYSLLVGTVAVRDDDMSIEDLRALFEEGEPKGKSQNNAVLVDGSRLTSPSAALSTPAIYRKRRRQDKLPLFSDGELQHFNLSQEGQGLVIQLYNKTTYLTQKDVKQFYEYIREVGPSAQEVKHVADMIEDEPDDERKALLLKLQLGGKAVKRSCVLKRWKSNFQIWRHKASDLEASDLEASDLEASDLEASNLEVRKDEVWKDDVNLFSDSSNIIREVPLLSVHTGPQSFSLICDFIGHAAFSELHDLAMCLRNGDALVLTGASGCGKSMMFSTLATFLHCIGNHRVLYLSGNVVIEDPVGIVKDALLLAYAHEGQEQLDIFHLSSATELTDWCRNNEDGMFVFLDDYNALDSEKSAANDNQKTSRDIARTLILNCFRSNHKILRCSSWSSSTASQYQVKRKNKTKYMVYFRSFFEKELACWKMPRPGYAARHAPG